jgi:hypothetical protein
MDASNPKQSAPTIAALIVSSLIAPFISQHFPVFSLTPEQIGWMQDAITAALITASTWGVHAWHVASLKAAALLRKQSTQTTVTTTTTTSAPAAAAASASAPTPSVTKLAVLMFLAGSTLVLSGSILTGCAGFTKAAKDITSPAAQPYITDAVNVALIAAEASGVKASQINAVAKTVLAADSGLSASLSALSVVAQQQIAKQKLPQADAAIIQVVLSAFDTALQAKIGQLAPGTATSVAATQAAVADILNSVIASTGG